MRTVGVHALEHVRHGSISRPRSHRVHVAVVAQVVPDRAHRRRLARVERGAGDGLVVYVCLAPVHGKHRLYAWLRQRYSARQQAAIFGRLVDVALLADG